MSIAELLDELELNGRRLIVVPAVRREDVDKVKEESTAKKKKMMDKRNMHLMKEGLTNPENFANSVLFQLLTRAISLNRVCPKVK